jgi:Chemotaxis phosphatase CheX
MSDDQYLGVIAGVAENLAFLMPIGPAEEEPQTWLIQSEVPWVGPDGSRGRIVVAFDREAAEATTANLLGLAPGAPLDANDIQESCNEFANVIAGNLLPVKYGNDHEFHLHPPLATSPQPLCARSVVLLALVEGIIGVAIDGDPDNSRILKAVSVPPGLRA